jgi:hypothetical protein
VLQHNWETQRGVGSKRAGVSAPRSTYDPAGPTHPPQGPGVARRTEAGERLMAWMSTVPDALDALVAAFRGAPGLADVTVFDGPTVTASAQQEAITVGDDGDQEDPTAVEGQNTREGLAAAPDREQYGIRCAVIVQDGSGNISAARRRAYQLLGEVGDVLAADQRLGGAVMMAQLGASTLAQGQDEDGATATISFNIEVDAFSRR